jgi:hypothetical protein
MEGASGCTNHPLSRGGGDGSLGGTLPTEDVVLGEHEREDAKAPSTSAEEVSRQRCQRLDRSERRGKKTPTLGSVLRDSGEW